MGVNENKIAMALESITVGMTTTVCGHVVTRWSIGRYEVGTFGKTSCSISEAVASILA